VTVCHHILRTGSGTLSVAWPGASPVGRMRLLRACAPCDLDALRVLLPHLAEVEIEEVSLSGGGGTVRIQARTETRSAACPVPGEEPGEREPFGISEHRLDGDEGVVAAIRYLLGQAGSGGPAAAGPGDELRPHHKPHSEDQLHHDP
jgi:hypothetical protein